VNLVVVGGAVAIAVDEGDLPLAQGTLDGPVAGALFGSGGPPVAGLITSLVGKDAAVAGLVGLLKGAVRLEVDVGRSRYAEKNSPAQ
jgi:hypothetical protein